MAKPFSFCHRPVIIFTLVIFALVSFNIAFMDTGKKKTMKKGIEESTNTRSTVYAAECIFFPEAIYGKMKKCQEEGKVQSLGDKHNDWHSDRKMALNQLAWLNSRLDGARIIILMNGRSQNFIKA